MQRTCRVGRFQGSRQEDDAPDFRFQLGLRNLELGTTVLAARATSTVVSVPTGATHGQAMTGKSDSSAPHEGCGGSEEGSQPASTASAPHTRPVSADRDATGFRKLP